MARSSGVDSCFASGRKAFRRSRQNRFKNCLGNGAQEQDQGTRWRFFQGLEKCIGGLRLHSLCIVDDGDFALQQRLALNGMLELAI